MSISIHDIENVDNRSLPAHLRQIEVLNQGRIILGVICALLILVPIAAPSLHGNAMASSALILGCVGLPMLLAAIGFDIRDNSLRRQRIERAIENRRRKEEQEAADRRKREQG